MRRTILTLCALALPLLTPISPASPALAQWLGPHLDAQRHNNLRRHQQRIREKRLQGRSANSPHVRRCAARYRSYDRRTDTYQVRPGVRARCRL